MNHTHAHRPHPRALVNTDLYPVEHPESDAYRSALEAATRDFSATGTVLLPAFLSDEGLERLCAAAQALDSRAFRSQRMANPYGVDADEGTPDDHPLRILSPTDRYGVAYHSMRDTSLGDFYRWPAVKQVVADVIGLSRLYLHDDPSNALVLQIYRPGGGLAWHFDRAGFSSTLCLQSAQEGGELEHVPALRSAHDECFDQVAAVLRGSRKRVIRCNDEPGGFSIFTGNRTLHRVATVKGHRARMSLVLSYEEQPGVKLDVATRKRFFGPDAPDDT